MTSKIVSVFVVLFAAPFATPEVFGQDGLVNGWELVEDKDTPKRDHEKNKVYALPFIVDGWSESETEADGNSLEGESYGWSINAWSGVSTVAFCTGKRIIRWSYRGKGTPSMRALSEGDVNGKYTLKSSHTKAGYEGKITVVCNQLEIGGMAIAVGGDSSASHEGGTIKIGPEWFRVEIPIGVELTPDVDGGAGAIFKDDKRQIDYCSVTVTNYAKVGTFAKRRSFNGPAVVSTDVNGEIKIDFWPEEVLDEEDEIKETPPLCESRIIPREQSQSHEDANSIKILSCPGPFSPGKFPHSFPGPGVPSSKTTLHPGGLFPTSKGTSLPYIQGNNYYESSGSRE